MRGARIFTAALLVAMLSLSLVSMAPDRASAQMGPAIDGIFPAASWVGLPVAIQGSNFGALQVPPESSVTFNGVDAGQAIVWSDNYIVVVVPEGATSGPVVVTTTFGSSDPHDFTVYEQPQVIPCYFAEGSTRAGFEEWLTVYNPYDEQYAATVTYLVADGANRIRYYNVPAHARITVYVNSEIGSDRDVSMVVSSTRRLHAERPLYFNYHDAWSGGHCSAPALTTSQTWFFAEGTTRAGFEEWLCLANPGPVDANVEVTYIFEDGSVLIAPCAVPAWKRCTVDVNAVVGSEKDVAMKVESDQPIVAERPMYFNYRDTWDDGHITTGAVSPETTWFFAEGTTRAGFEEWLCLANPGEEDAKVRITYRVSEGGSVSQNIAVPAGRRRTVDVNAVVGPDKDVAMVVESDQPIVAERPMYFNYRSAWDGGHLSMGTPATASSWFFAEGTTRAGFEEWLCLFNPGDREAQVKVVYAFQNAAVREQQFALHPGQRFSIPVNEVVGAERDVGIRVESNPGIVAERSLYFLYHGAWDGGHNAMGVAP